MAREFTRSQRVGDFLQQELARLIQQEVRDPRAHMVSVTGVDVTRDFAHAKVYYTQLGVDSREAAEETTQVLNGAAGFLRSRIARSATMRTVPRLQFRFDESVGYGRSMEQLIDRVKDADRRLRDAEDEDPSVGN
ncbi:ribosome-binding factor A [Luminiphilus syltensis NOR5-1B]|uniref:Ribosome-binding factor A n=1 Tax=Luminiphilus syltensis NOR5-1B TaxID=565045 RepID=B8KRZ8_9GAMM|nr:30S ribosome-binding factor RbfA [Luminiphilus syltensis]EED34988.1 ribosome-binding factor A [Luminiphilus syltensis NOR5-1B]